ncbi:hypothetical protein V8F06_011899 [Rhypophila decipiens]
MSRDHLNKDTPTEILLMIGDELKKSNAFPALSSLTRVSRRLHDIFELILYKFNVQCKKTNRLSALVWGAEFGRLGTVQKALQYGEDVDFKHQAVIFPAHRLNTVNIVITTVVNKVDSSGGDSSSGWC